MCKNYKWNNNACAIKVACCNFCLKRFFIWKLLRAKKIEIFDVRSAFRTNSLPGSGSSSANNSLGRSLRNDLLVAADSVTNAMSTLVRELNSGMLNDKCVTKSISIKND